MPVQVASLAEWEQSGVEGMLSVVIPAHNEEGHIRRTLTDLAEALDAAAIDYEILVVNDNSDDETEEALKATQAAVPGLRYVNNSPPKGFGFAVRLGLAAFKGDAVVIVMADGSDAPADVVKFYKKLCEGYDCVFGTRFGRGGSTTGYPLPKLILNRIGNIAIRILFGVRYNDMTNAFKMYRRSVIAGIQPILARHFNLTVELPLKAVVRGYSYVVVSNTWRNREMGSSKFRVKEMGSRYLFIILYCLMEKWLSRGDYRNTPELREKQLQVWPR